MVSVILFSNMIELVKNLVWKSFFVFKIFLVVVVVLLGVMIDECMNILVNRLSIMIMRYRSLVVFVQISGEVFIIWFVMLVFFCYFCCLIICGVVFMIDVFNLWYC